MKQPKKRRGLTQWEKFLEAVIESSIWETVVYVNKSYSIVMKKEEHKNEDIWNRSDIVIIDDTI